MTQTAATRTELRYWTLAEYLACDDETETRYELIDGQRVAMPPESDLNLSIARWLLLEFVKHLPPDRVVWGTEVAVTGRRATCRLPDLLVHSEESKAAIATSRRATLTADMPPPALVVEVVSPGQANRDRDYRYKRVEYAARGIQEYWIVDPELPQVTLCEWVNGLYEERVYAGTEPIRSGVVLGFALTPAEIFGDRPPANPDPADNP